MSDSPRPESPLGAERCAACGRRFDAAALTDVGGRLVCPRCEAAARAVADATPDAAPVPAPAAPVRKPPGPVIAVRSADASPTGLIPAMVRSMREWAAGRWWWWRLAILLYLVYATGRHLAEPEYQSWFKALNLGIHEWGHVVFRAFGPFMEILGGSLLQCLAPPLCILMFFKQRDWFAIAFCFGWLGLNLFEVATYVADARAMQLPLVSPFASGADIIHDWNWLLRRTGLLLYDRKIAGVLRVAATVSTAAFVVPGSWLLWVMFRSGGRAGS